MYLRTCWFYSQIYERENFLSLPHMECEPNSFPLSLYMGGKKKKEVDCLHFHHVEKEDNWSICNFWGVNWILSFYLEGELKFTIFTITHQWKMILPLLLVLKHEIIIFFQLNDFQSLKVVFIFLSKIWMDLIFSKVWMG